MQKLNVGSIFRVKRKKQKYIVISSAPNDSKPGYFVYSVSLFPNINLDESSRILVDSEKIFKVFYISPNDEKGKEIINHFLTSPNMRHHLPEEILPILKENEEKEWVVENCKPIVKSYYTGIKYKHVFITFSLFIFFLLMSISVFFVFIEDATNNSPRSHIIILLIDLLLILLYVGISYLIGRYSFSTIFNGYKYFFTKISPMEYRRLLSKELFFTCKVFPQLYISDNYLRLKSKVESDKFRPMYGDLVVPLDDIASFNFYTYYSGGDSPSDPTYPCASFYIFMKDGTYHKKEISNNNILLAVDAAKKFIKSRCSIEIIDVYESERKEYQLKIKEKYYQSL